MKLLKKALRILFWIIWVPIILFLVLATLLYLPPIQRAAVGYATHLLSSFTQYEARVGYVRLAFPLDLTLHEVSVDDGTDTPLLTLSSLRLDISLGGLLKGTANIEGFEVYGLYVDTKEMISDVCIRGNIGSLTAASHGVEWGPERARLDFLSLGDANLYIALSDTAQEDSTESPPTRWAIDVEKVEVDHVEVALSLPGDTVLLRALIGEAALRGGQVDLGGERGERYALESLRLAQSAVNYDLTTQPCVIQGVDVNHIALDSMFIELDSLLYDTYGGSGALRLNLSFRERCGFEVSSLSGRVTMDSLQVELADFVFRTPNSCLTAEVVFPFDALEEGDALRTERRELYAALSADFGAEDLRLLAGGGSAWLSDTLLETFLSPLPRGNTVSIDMLAQGNATYLQLQTCEIQWPGFLALSANAEVGHPFDSLRRNGSADFALTMEGREGSSQRLGGGESNSSDSGTATLSLPENLLSALRGMQCEGHATLVASAITSSLRLAVDTGEITAQASLDTEKETYAARLEASAFPIAAFLTGLPVRPLTFALSAEGRGFSPLTSRRRETWMEASATFDSLTYDQYCLSGTSLQVHLIGDSARATLISDTHLFRGKADLAARVTDNTFPQADFTLRLDIDSLDLGFLMRPSLPSDTLFYQTNFTLSGYTDLGLSEFDLKGGLRDMRFFTADGVQTMRDVAFGLRADADTTEAVICSGDMALMLAASKRYDVVLDQTDSFLDLGVDQLQARAVNLYALRKRLPRLSLSFDSGNDNPLHAFLERLGYEYSSASLRLNTAPDEGIYGTANVGRLKVGDIRVDTLMLDLSQDTMGIRLESHALNNRADNPAKFSLDLMAYLLNAGAGAEIVFRDAEGVVGLDLGLRAEANEQGISLNLYPENPVVAFRNFSLNERNYIRLTPQMGLEADLQLLADDGTAFNLYSTAQDSASNIHADLNRLNLCELSASIPFMPALEGFLSADVHADYAPASLVATAKVDVNDFAYDGAFIGNMGVRADYSPDGIGRHRVETTLIDEGREVVLVEGDYLEEIPDQQAEAFLGKASVEALPLGLLNGFMEGTDIYFRGALNGAIDIGGTLDAIELNGGLAFDTAHIYSEVYGIDFLLDTQRVDIASSVLTFDNFTLSSSGNEPLTLNGTVDMSDFSDIPIGIGMKTCNFELINAERKKNSLLYGKVYANFDGMLQGNLDYLSIKGNVMVLGNTDATYILEDSPLTVENRLEDLVQFVDFSDTLSVLREEAVELGMVDIRLGVNVSTGAQFHCLLSADGKSYVDIQGGGDLTLRIPRQGDMTLSGRFTATNGKMKYEMPIIPLKTFTLSEGSYVEFTGEMMNPNLNISATERMKAVVNSNDQQRSVTFDVGLTITGNLENMGLTFTIEAPNDLTVQNELASLSDDQRQQTAITMLATGLYINENSSSSFGTSSLTSFLQSEIQVLQSNGNKGIDLSVGVESGVSSTGGTSTDYSFQFSKRLWNDRVSIIIGGKVSSGDTDEEDSQAFIDNITLEYRLDESATRYLKLYYDRDSNDPFEGQLTETGLGLVLRKKSDKLGDLFIFRRKESRINE